MRFPTFDSVFMILGILLQGMLCIVLFRKRLARNYPIFFVYLLINLAEDPLSLLWNPYSPGYRRYYFIASLVDYVLQLLIIFEIGQNVLRPSRRALALPVPQLATVATLLCVIVAVGFAMPSHALNGDMIQWSLQVALVLSILKILLFVVLAGFAQMLGIGWKNHVLQLATGLAFFAAIQLLIQIASSHLSQYSANYMAHLDGLMHLQTLAYGATLAFWIWAFSRNEAPRKDFTPQMQEVLVTIAHTARRTRMAVTRSTDRR